MTSSTSFSALNTLLSCRLQYYYRYIKQIRLPEPEEVASLSSFICFGNVFHGALRHLYAPYVKKQVDVQTIQELHSTQTLNHAIRAAAEEEEVPWPLKGQDLVLLDVLKNLLKSFLTWDKKQTPYLLMEVEAKEEFLLAVRDSLKVRLMGYIDRIYQKNDTLYVVDYKTGSLRDQHKFPEDIATLFDIHTPSHKREVLQLLLYGLMCASSYKSQKIAPLLLYVRHLYNAQDPVSHMLRQRQGRKYAPLEDLRPLQTSLEKELGQSMHEILGETHFCQTPDEKVCTYCDFKDICHR